MRVCDFVFVFVCPFDFILRFQVRPLKEPNLDQNHITLH